MGIVRVRKFVSEETADNLDIQDQQDFLEDEMREEIFRQRRIVEQQNKEKEERERHEKEEEKRAIEEAERDMTADEKENAAYAREMAAKSKEEEERRETIKRAETKKQTRSKKSLKRDLSKATPFRRMLPHTGRVIFPKAEEWPPRGEGDPSPELMEHIERHAGALEKRISEWFDTDCATQHLDTEFLYITPEDEAADNNRYTVDYTILRNGNYDDPKKPFEFGEDGKIASTNTKRLFTRMFHTPMSPSDEAGYSMPLTIWVSNTMMVKAVFKRIPPYHHPKDLAREAEI